MLEKIIKKIVGADKYVIMKTVAKGVSAKTQHLPGHIWADYLFIAACYSSVIGDEIGVDRLVKTIKKDFPNYGPSTRFSFKRMESEDIGNSMYIVPVIGAMNQFCESHPDFAFSNFEKYFPDAKDMSVKKEEK